jgi:hypothetical protein
MKTRLILFLLLLVSSLAWAEQACDKTFPMSTPVERFTDNGDGTLFDIEPDLTWMRCSLGQTWTGTACTGIAAAYTWQSAQDAASKLNSEGGYANRHDWRVPKISELASIAERQCSNPRINLALFPATPPAYYWTDTMRPGSAKDDPYAYAISFGSEGPKHAGKNEKFNVRLVSGGEKTK